MIGGVFSKRLGFGFCDLGFLTQRVVRRLSGFGFEVWDLGLRVSGSRFRVRVSRFGLHVSNFVFRVRV